jgi:hypothetical protein
MLLLECDRSCAIWRGFAATGIGVGSASTVRGKRVTITESFALPASCPWSGNERWRMGWECKFPFEYGISK